MRLFISTIFCSFLFIHLSLYPLFGQNDPVKPNFVLIVADDLGYADLGFHGSKQIPTPSIDRLAESGIIFTNGYVSSPVCSPSRAGLITGKNQVSFGFDNNLFPAQPGFDPNYVGLPLTDLVLSLDICPTFIEAAGGKISEKDNYRGVNIIPFLTGQTDKVPHVSMEWKYTVSTAIREGNWKLIRLPDRFPVLHNLSDDISELNDVALQNLDRTKAMLKKLGTWDIHLPHPVFLEPFNWRIRHLGFYDADYQLVQSEQE